MDYFSLVSLKKKKHKTTFPFIENNYLCLMMNCGILVTGNFFSVKIPIKIKIIVMCMDRRNVIFLELCNT